MATNFPTGLDTPTNPTNTDYLDTVGVLHATLHTNTQDAIKALEAKVGINGSAVATSLEYRLTNHVNGADPHTQYQKESERNAANGYVGLDASSLISASQIPDFPESKVTNLVTDLSTITTTLGLTVRLTGDQTVAGIKTFSSPPVIPTSSLPESAITNLVTDLAAKVDKTGFDARGTIGSRPASGTYTGYRYVATDVHGGTTYRWNGSSYDIVTSGLNSATNTSAAASINVTNQGQGDPWYVTDANIPTGAVAPQTSGRPNAPGLYVYDVRWNPPWNLPWGIMGYAEKTSTQNVGVTTADVSSLSITFTPVANRRYLLRAFLEVSCDADSNISVIIATSGNTQLQISTISTSLGFFFVHAPIVFQSPAGGSALTYKVRLTNSAGTSTVQASATQPAMFIIEDMGPNGQPS